VEPASASARKQQHFQLKSGKRVRVPNERFANDHSVFSVKMALRMPAAFFELAHSLPNSSHILQVFARSRKTNWSGILRVLWTLLGESRTVALFHGRAERCVILVLPSFTDRG
jgi:muconolactone delta-isomerase